MIIEIEPAVAEDPASQIWLLRILARMEDGWHLWHVRNADVLLATEWVHESPRVRALLEANIRRQAWNCDGSPHGRGLRITLEPVDGGRELRPEEACRLAEEPLRVLVENRVSDGAFLKRVTRDLEPAINGLWAQAGQPLRLDSCGGKGQMEVEVQRTAEAMSRPRLVVVVDSDKRGPDDPPSREARRLQATCEELGVPCWLLAKREAENYLPRELLDERLDVGAEHRQGVDAWDRASDDQKDFYDMKAGLADEPGAVEEALFAALDPRDRETLQHGFGGGVGDCWDIEGVDVRQPLRDRGRGDLECGLETLRRGI